MRIVIPDRVARASITGILLALARVMGETAPVLVLVGYCQVDQLRHLRAATWRSLPLLIYDQSWPTPEASRCRRRVWGAALTLILLIAVLNLGARCHRQTLYPQRENRVEEF